MSGMADFPILLSPGATMRRLEWSGRACAYECENVDYFDVAAPDIGGVTVQNANPNDTVLLFRPLRLPRISGWTMPAVNFVRLVIRQANLTDVKTRVASQIIEDLRQERNRVLPIRRWETALGRYTTSGIAQPEFEIAEEEAHLRFVEQHWSSADAASIFLPVKSSPTRSKMKRLLPTVSGVQQFSFEIELGFEDTENIFYYDVDELFGRWRTSTCIWGRITRFDNPYRIVRGSAAAGEAPAQPFRVNALPREIARDWQGGVIDGYDIVRVTGGHQRIELNIYVPQNSETLFDVPEKVMQLTPAANPNERSLSRTDLLILDASFTGAASRVDWRFFAAPAGFTTTGGRPLIEGVPADTEVVSDRQFRRTWAELTTGLGPAELLDRPEYILGANDRFILLRLRPSLVQGLRVAIARYAFTRISAPTFLNDRPSGKSWRYQEVMPLYCLLDRLLKEHPDADTRTALAAELGAGTRFARLSNQVDNAKATLQQQLTAGQTCIQSILQNAFFKEEFGLLEPEAAAELTADLFASVSGTDAGDQLLDQIGGDFLSLGTADPEALITFDRVSGWWGTGTQIRDTLSELVVQASITRLTRELSLSRSRGVSLDLDDVVDKLNQRYEPLMGMTVTREGEHFELRQAEGDTGSGVPGDGAIGKISTVASFVSLLQSYMNLTSSRSSSALEVASTVISTADFMKSVAEHYTGSNARRVAELSTRGVAQRLNPFSGIGGLAAAGTAVNTIQTSIAVLDLRAHGDQDAASYTVAAAVVGSTLTYVGRALAMTGAGAILGGVVSTIGILMSLALQRQAEQRTRAPLVRLVSNTALGRQADANVETYTFLHDEPDLQLRHLYSLLYPINVTYRANVGWIDVDIEITVAKQDSIFKVVFRPESSTLREFSFHERVRDTQGMVLTWSNGPSYLISNTANGSPRIALRVPYSRVALDWPQGVSPARIDVFCSYGPVARDPSNRDYEDVSYFSFGEYPQRVG